MSQLIEGFENWSGGAPVGWTKHGAVVFDQSTSHVTQGTYSLHASNGSRYLSMGHTAFDPPYPGACYISVDVFVVSGAVKLGINNVTYSVQSSGLGAQTLTLYAPSPIFNMGFIGTSLPGTDEFYADNIRYLPEITIPSTKEFKLTGQIPSVLLDTVTSIPSTTGFEISYGTITTITDVVVNMVDTVRFKLDFASAVIDWDSDDWEYPDWATISTSPGFRAFVDTVVRVDAVKDFDLVFSPIVVIGDYIVPVPSTKAYDLTLASGINAYVATIVRPDTKQFKLNLPTDIEAYSEAFREYVVMLNSPFQYEILGVNVGTVEGGGRMTVFVDDQIIASDLLIDSDKTNIPLSGIINRGQRLWVGLYMKNGYFRSFDATFALKRDQT